MDQFNVYKDMKARTNGEIYIGVVGPVRTGKSTFIKRFMNLMVLPNIEDENDINRANDELPQSSSGKTIMTTEPKFVPNEAVSIKVEDGIELNVRLIDCVSLSFVYEWCGLFARSHNVIWQRLRLEVRYLKPAHLLVPEVLVHHQGNEYTVLWLHLQK